MARRMIDPQTIIKSQIVDDKEAVDLNEILEKYGTQGEYSKSITLQFYSKETADDNDFPIYSDTGVKGYIIANGAITITKLNDNNTVYISGLVVGSISDMKLLISINIDDGDYENGIILESYYPFDVHVIKV